MHRNRTLRQVFFLAGALGFAAVAPGYPQVVGPNAKVRSMPRLEPVAEIRVLMRGINLPNIQGLERSLKEKPGKAETWTTIRGQALLIAENGNLLMLRPPKSLSEKTWMERALALRTVATDLARSATERDYARSLAGLKDLAATCNRCHQSSQVDVAITTFGAGHAGGRFAPPAAPAVPEVPRPPAPPRRP